MLEQIGTYLVRTIFEMVVYLALLRFYMQAFRAPFRNPVGQFVIALTDWAVLPLRRIVPGWRGLDLASLAFAIIVELAMLALLMVILGANLSIGKWLILALLGIAKKSLYLLVIVVLIDFILQFVNPYTAIGPVLQSITRPFYNIFRKIIPPIKGIDLSPAFVLIAIQIILFVLNGWEAMVMRATG